MSRWCRHVSIEEIKKLSYMFWMREFLAKMSLTVRDLTYDKDMTRREWWESFVFMLPQIVFLPITVILVRWYLIASYEEHGLMVDNRKNILIMENIKCK